MRLDLLCLIVRIAKQSNLTPDLGLFIARIAKQSNSLLDLKKTKKQNSKAVSPKVPPRGSCLRDNYEQVTTDLSPPTTN